MPHADSTVFGSAPSKAAVYDQIYEQTVLLLADQRNWVCNLANVASLLWHGYKSLPYPTSSVNWAGFYTLHPKASSTLILGPFQGKVACQTISFGRGVCGAAASKQSTQLVHDVDKFPGHIACDGDSRSEIVVPIVVGGKVVAIIDIDCTEVGGFDEVDKQGLERLAEHLAHACDW